MGTSSSNPAKKRLRILCFGDSLTEGYGSGGWTMTPYSKWLEEYLNGTVDDEYEIEVVTDGRSGDCVTEGFERRMRRHFPEPPTSTSQTPYDWTIFLGGTNDLAYRAAPSTILSTTTTILSYPLTHGSKVLIMTVPEIASHALDEGRNELNELIKGWAREREGVWGLDLWARLRYHGIGEEKRMDRWDDGLHFSVLGYEELGGLVGERLVEILRGG